MKPRSKLPPPGHPDRYCYVELPTCPKCHGIDLPAYRSEWSDARTVARHVRCRDCGHRFIVVAEAPEKEIS